MDNKNQNNNGVEDDFNNLSSEEILNNLEEGILNQSDLFDQHNLVSDFSIVKDGFKQNFIKNKPPKFIWDKIEQELESMNSSDDVSEFSSIKSGFEENFKNFTKPGLSWDDLEDEMDNPTPKKEDDDYSLVKNGFEKKFSTVVLPLFTWDDLVARMDDDAANSDTAENYSIIKESFDDQFMKLSNPVSWSELNTRLEQETIKGKIIYQFARFRKKIMKAGVVALLLLFCKTCVYDNISPAQPELAIIVTDQVEGNAKNKVFTENIENPVIIKSQVKEDDKKVLLQPFDNKKDKSLAESSKEKINKVQNALSADNVDLFSDNNSMMQGESLEQFHSLPPSLSIALINNPPSTSLSFTESFSRSYFNSNVPEKESLNKTELFNDLAIIKPQTDNKLSEIQQQKELYNSFPVVDLSPLDYLNHSDILSIEQQKVEKVEMDDNYKSLVFEFGLIGKIGTGMLLGKTASDALESKSLSTTSMKPSGGLGVLLNCFFTKNDAVVLTAIPHSEVRQSFGSFTRDGYYLMTDLKLSYFDISIGYQRNLINFASSGNTHSRIYTRLDFGVGILTNGETKINNEIITNENSFNNYNLNLGLSLGSAHQFGHFVFDYGLTGNLGMASIINSSSSQSLNEPANLMNVGGYISVRYVLSSQYKVSGKRKNLLHFHPNH